MDTDADGIRQKSSNKNTFGDFIFVMLKSDFLKTLLLLLLFLIRVYLCPSVVKNSSLRDQTIRSEPLMLTRRNRVKVSGLVTPSPVGVAMEKLGYPSPPLPRHAVHGPLTA